MKYKTTMDALKRIELELGRDTDDADKIANIRSIVQSTFNGTPARSYKSGTVQHVMTGKLYASASAAARAHSLSPATMSLHLNKPGDYPTINGHVFRRI